MSVKRIIPRWFAVMILASLAIVGYGISHPQTRPEPVNEPIVAGPNDLLDCMWLDQAPQMADDPWKAYLFTPENFGLNIDAHSSYKLVLELFEFKADSKAITYKFPHPPARKGKTTYKIERLKKPTKYFDTQLTIDNDPQNEGKTSIYFTGPDFRSASQLPEALRQTLESQHLLEYLPE